MTNEELKKKIVEILDNNIRWQPYYYISRGIVYEDDLKNIADALILAGICDISDLEAKREELRLASEYYINELKGAEKLIKKAEHRDR